MITDRIPGWFLPSAYLFLLPFGNLFILPLVLMVIIYLVHFYRYGMTSGFWQDNNNRHCAIVFGLVWIPMLVSLPDAINFEHSLKSTLGVLPLLFAGIYIIHILGNHKDRQQLHIAVIVITTLWCVDALFQLIFGTDFLGFSSHMPAHLSGVFSPKYTLGLVLAVVLPVVLEGLRRIAVGYMGILMACVLAAIHIAVIILSGARTALLMLIIGVSGWLIYVACINRSFAWRKIIPVFALVLAISGYLSSQQPDWNRYTTLSEVIGADLKTIDKISSGRIALWETAGRITLNHWINGIGPRGFRHAYDAYRPVEGKYSVEFPYGSTHPHFVLLEIAAETGVIGLICIFTAIFLLFRQLRLLSDTMKLDAFPWMLGATIAIIPNIAKAFYSSFWLSLVLWMIFIGIANSRIEKA